MILVTGVGTLDPMHAPKFFVGAVKESAIWVAMIKVYCMRQILLAINIIRIQEEDQIP